MNNIIFLNLDGVLITTFHTWEKDELDSDVYSKFNPDYVNRLQQLLKDDEEIKAPHLSSLVLTQYHYGLDEEPYQKSN